MASYKSPFGPERFKRVGELEEYVRQNHLDKVPDKYKGDVAHFLHDLRNPEKRKCQICGAKTSWNPKLKKYNVLCSTPGVSHGFDFSDILKKSISFFKNRCNSCEAVMRKQYLENINKIYNTDNLMEDPEYQKMLLDNRKIAEVVTINYKGEKLEYTVIGSYEKLFVESWYKNIHTKDILLSIPGPTIKLPNGSYTIIDASLYNGSILISIKDKGEIDKYAKNYKKSILAYDTINKGEKAYFEFNGKEEVTNAPMYIHEYIEGKRNKKDKVFKPNYYDKYKEE